MSKKPTTSIKEQKNVIEVQLKSKQSKKRYAELKTMLSKLNLLEKEERDQKRIEAEKLQKQKLEQEKQRQKEKDKQEEIKVEQNDELRLICKFFIEANNRKNFQCPDPNCRDVHELDEEQTFDDVIQNEMMNVRTNDKVTEETFMAWVKKKEKEDKIHQKKKDAIQNGIELFKLRPEMFEDSELSEEED